MPSACGDSDASVASALFSSQGTVYIGPRVRRRASWWARPPGLKVTELDYTRFEKARIIGARALQVSMGAPPLIEIPNGIRNPVSVAMLEYEADAIPLTVQRSKTHQVNA